MKEKFDEQLRYTKTKTYIILRYIIAIGLIFMYPLHHNIMTHCNVKYNDTYLFHLAVACGIGLFVFFEGEIKGLFVLYMEHQKDKQAEQKYKIIAEYKIEKETSKDNE
jgi:hypothetical protein